MIAHVELPLSHRSGFPAQVPAQHSSFVEQAIPAAVQADVHTGIPASFAVHDPAQHVSEAAHGAPRGRHGPAPNSHRDVTGSQLSHGQQGGMLSFEHASPAARHNEGARLQTPTEVPGRTAHSPEQQSPLTAQGSPATLHSAGPHVPLLQPREQQSEALVHGAPLTRQYDVHWFEREISTGSHLPLQQSPGDMHCDPGPLHVPA